MTNRRAVTHAVAAVALALAGSAAAPRPAAAQDLLSFGGVLWISPYANQADWWAVQFVGRENPASNPAPVDMTSDVEGNFWPLAAGTARADIWDFRFSTATPGLVAGQHDPFFEVSAPGHLFRFTLESAPAAGGFGPLTFSLTPVGTVVSFGVVGTVVGTTIYDPTPYVGLFTTQFPGLSPTQVRAELRRDVPVARSFSATFLTEPAVRIFATPEPATLALVAGGALLVGAGTRRTRGRRAAG
jgi:hypothetical protein